MGANIHNKLEVCLIQTSNLKLVIPYLSSIDKNLEPWVAHNCAMGGGSVKAAIDTFKSAASSIPGDMLQGVSLSKFFKEAEEALRNPKVLTEMPSEWTIQRVNGSYRNLDAKEVKFLEPEFCERYLAGEEIHLVEDHAWIYALANNYPSWMYLPYVMANHCLGEKVRPSNEYLDELGMLLSEKTQKKMVKKTKIGAEIIFHDHNFYEVLTDGSYKKMNWQYSIEGDVISNHPTCNFKAIQRDLRVVRKWLKEAPEVTGFEEVQDNGQSVSFDANHVNNLEDLDEKITPVFGEKEWLDWNGDKSKVKDGMVVKTKEPISFGSFESTNFEKSSPRKGMRNVWWSIDTNEFVRISCGLGLFKIVS